MREDRRQTDVPFEMTSNGVAYRAFGDGPPLVLFHGGAGNWHHWVMNVDALATRFRVLATDHPSYGDSRALGWTIGVDAYLDHFHAAVEEMTEGAPGVHLSGFSFGGYIAADMAVRLGPRTRSLSMIGGAGYGKPVGRPFTLDSRKRMTERLGRDPSADELAAMHRQNLGKLMLWDKSKIDDWAVAMQGRNVDRTRFDSRRISWEDGVPEMIGRLAGPVMVVYGEHDAAAIPPVAERFARCRAARSDVRTELIADCGHWAMYEAPEGVNRLMLDFHGSAQ
ncbi:MAG: alpha/beta hydrolase [Pseudomonadota bacterium]